MNEAKKRPLPEAWRWVRLGDVCEIRARQVDPTDPQYAALPHVSGENIESGTCRLLDTRTAAEDGMISGKYLFEPGEVLYSKLRPYLRKVILAEFQGVCSADMYPISTKEEFLDSRFLAWLLLSNEFTRYADAESRRARMPKLNREQLFAWTVALPPVQEQRRIAAILSDQMAAVDSARRSADARLEAARALPAAYLRKIFDGTTSGGWPSDRLGKLLSLRKEIVHSRDNPNGKDVFVGLEHIESGTGCRIGSLEIDKEDLTGRKPRFYEGDIVYGYLRPYLNKVWVAEFDGLCSVDQNVYSVDQTRADTGFVTWFMRSPVYLERAPIGSTPGQLPRIRIEEVASVEIPLPPLAEQRRVAGLIMEMMTSADRLRKAAEEELAGINALPAALLRRAFSGEL